MSRARSNTRDWMPHDRQGQINMAEAWMNVFGEEVMGADGQMVRKWKVFGLSPELFAAFSTAYGAALAAFEQAMSAERSEIITKRCEVTFGNLVAIMRDIKRRFFHKDPLSETDFIKLNIKERDGALTVYGDADAIYGIAVYGWGLRELKLRFTMLEGNPENPANGFLMLMYKVVAPGEPVPLTPDDLTKPFLTQRIHTEKMRFEYGDSGKTVYMAIRSGKGGNGRWGPMASAVIP